jgi:hypothetical protein
MVINKICLKEAEEILKEISEESIKLKISQEELEGINLNLGDIESELKLGKISKKIYREFKTDLEREKRDLEVKIKKIIDKTLINSNKLYKIISDSKI